MEALEPQESWDFDYFRRVKDDIDKHLTAGAEDDRFPILPQRIVRAVREAMPDDGILALDNGMFKIWFARNYKAYGPNTVLLDNALAAMGAGLPSAMTAKLVYPERAVVAVCGDGGFMMNSQEIETAVRLKLDLVVLVLNDHAYGMIEWKQLGSGYQKFGLDFGNPDFVRYAQAYGARGDRIGSADELTPKIKNALKTGGVWIIDVPTDYSENVKDLTTRLQERTCEL